LTNAKYIITGFLVLVSLLAATQTVQSQQYATTTLTTLLTSNQVSTATVGTQVMTTTSGQLSPVYVGPNVTIPGTHGVCGEYFNQPFNATAGEVLTGTVTASNPVNVYLMTSPAFQAWQHQVVAGGTCTPSGSVASQTSITSYALGTPIPATGNYELVVNNLSESSVTVQITANLASASPSLVTVVAYSTVTQPMVQTLMQTSVQTLQTTSSGPDMTTVAAVIFAIIVIAAAAYVAKTRQSKSQKK
jgi:hypothetical protein